MQKNNALITDVTNRYSNNSEWTDNVKKHQPVVITVLQ